MIGPSIVKSVAIVMLSVVLSMSITLGAVGAPLSALGDAPTRTPPDCRDVAGAEANLAALREKILPLTNSVAIEQVRQTELVNFLIDTKYDGWCRDHAPRTSGIRATGPIVQGPTAQGQTSQLSFGTHARARVYYSKQVVDWLLAGREGSIPDGAMIVKEMFAYPEKVNTDAGEENPAGWAVMLRDKASSHMGWIWGLYFQPDNQTYLREYMTIQAGLSYCASCHASTDNTEGTFSFIGNLFNDDVATYVQSTPPVHYDNSLLADLLPQSIGDLGPHASFARYDAQVEDTLYTPRQVKPLSRPNSALLAMLRSQLDLAELPKHANLQALPKDFLYDRKLPKGQDEQDHHNGETFFTSSACVGCHNAANLLNNTLAHGQLPSDQFVASDHTEVNVSPYGEWQGSMMAMSGRDPIFRAQVEWEAASITDSKKAEEVTALCMSCHSVMGERSHPELAASIANTNLAPNIDAEDHSPSDNPGYEFGALARDGVSCMVCHRMTDENLGEPASFTGKFSVTPGKEIFGPYKDVQEQPMHNAIGMTPKQGKHIQSSALCGSCHTIHLPVLHNDREVKTTYEQTTYLEWLNSDYSKKSTRKAETGDELTCQECHMPRRDPTRPGETLTVKLANIEDSSFPYVPNRAPAEQLVLEDRDTYRRHTLVGANLFGQSMFEQFPNLLGAHLFWPGQDPSMAYSRMLSIAETRKMAQEQSATVNIAEVAASADNLVVDVDVTNLAGHKLPSGVGFRRAFLEVSVLDDNGELLWCSGCTNDAGVIVNNQQEPLAGEFARREEDLEPDRQVITESEQVQVYEHRALDCDKNLTSSFVHLCEEVKDNRLLPKGWQKKGPWAEVTKPVAQSGRVTPGRDRVRYRIQLAQGAEVGHVRAVLNYQPTPPHYLVDRFRLLDSVPVGTFPELERLLYIALHLDTRTQPGMHQWKTMLACAKRGVSDTQSVGCSD